ncbi:MAG: DNA-binding protein WhiA [Oscillospiraceae bacterium]|nr:DNA-binding protein WhiA [Oscillospiraceae bacterium]
MKTSFSSDVKRELCAVPADRLCCCSAELYGAFLFSQLWNAAQLRLVTTHPDVPGRLDALLVKRFGFTFDGSESAGHALRVIRGEAKLNAIFHAYGLERRPGLSIHLNHAALEGDCCRAAFCRGVFLSGGSMTDPEKKYHLELVTPHRHLTRELLPILHEHGFEPRPVTRGAIHALLFQSSETIEDFLTFTGAPLSSLALMQVKQLKDLRNQVNRHVNCDTGNMERTLTASARQMERFERLRGSPAWDTLPVPLQTAVAMRLENPDASLTELAGMLGIGRSALNHRLRKLERELEAES